MSMPGGAGPGAFPPSAQNYPGCPAAGSAGYQTQIYPGYSPQVRQSLDGTTLAWSISALVLGFFCLVLYAVIWAASSAIPGAYLSALPRFVAALGFFSAAAVVTASIAVLARQEWGRRLLVVAIAGALVTLALDLTVALQAEGSASATQPALQQALPTPSTPYSPGAPLPPFGFRAARPMAFPGVQPMGFPASQPMVFPGAQPMVFPGAQPMVFPGAQPMVFPGAQPMGFPGARPAMTQQSAAFRAGFHFGAIVGDLAKMGYCLGLLLFMVSPKAKAAIRR